MQVTIKAGRRKINIGEIYPEDHLFKKKVQKSKHLFQKLDAWGIDGKYFVDVLEPNNYDIEVFDQEEDKLYKTNAEKYRKYGEFYHFKDKQCRDHNSQIFLSRRYFD